MKSDDSDWLLVQDKVLDVQVADLINVVDKDIYLKKLESYNRERIFEESNIQKYIGMYEQFLPLKEKNLLAPFSSNILSELDRLKQKFTNGCQLLSDIEALVYLDKIVSHSHGEKLNCHILIEGHPGCSKTTLAHHILKVMSPDSYKLNLSMYSEAFQVSGLIMGYSSGCPGLIAQYMKNSKFANFFILVDEVDKGAMLSSSRTSAYVPLYQLLEPSTAKYFDDTAL